MSFDLVLKHSLSDSKFNIQNYTHEILEFKTISIHIIYKNSLVTFVSVVFLPKMNY